MLFLSSPVVLLEGDPVVQKWHIELQSLRENFERSQGRKPTLAVIRVGNDPASLIYVKNKRQQARRLGIGFEEHTLEREQVPEGLFRKIQALNQNPKINGIILQLPLPAGLDPEPFLAAIDLLKDVDGLHPLNRGLLYSQSKEGFIPCTPLGCLRLLEFYGFSVPGKEVVVIGRSVLVGRPLAALLLKKGATVTIAHSQTANLAAIIKRADFLFVAMGKSQFVRGEHVKRGAVVVDIGIHRRAKSTVVGDVDFDSVSPHVSAITPVPGGVGPLTVMGLMHNTLKAAYLQCTLPFPLCSPKD